ncbi:MAG: hypothetical protein EPN88_03430 [Bacteroidetes bacterium]|nr:MAG: hypothetical protein EPN88_03430 [Bacteroidota bacterium]
MKKYIYISLLCSVISIIPIFGQDYQYQSTTVQTPKSVTVDAYQFMYWTYNDYTAPEIDAWNYYWTSGYNCRILANSTKYYNCHGYAWYNIEGRMSQSTMRWINDVDQYGNPIYNVTKYYTGTNKSYTETATITNHLRVSYFPRDHSAVTTENQDSVISKWANGPLVKHTLAQCPFYNNAVIKYYRLYPEIDGSTEALCANQERTFTSTTTIPTSTYTWTKDDSRLDLVSGAGTPSFRVKAKNTSGNAWVNLQITTPSGEVATIPYKYFWIGIFANNVVTGQAAVCPNSIYTYTAQVPGGHYPSYSYSWTYPANWMYPYQYQNTIRLQTPMYPYYGTVRVSITNACGTSAYSGITVYPGYGCGGYYTIYPNPA